MNLVVTNSLLPQATRSAQQPGRAAATAETSPVGADAVSLEGTAIQAVPSEVRVNYAPQDPSTMPVLETTVAGEDVGATLEGPRLRMDDATSAAADADGNYLFAPGTAGFQQANSFICADKTLDLFEEAVGHTIPWAFDDKLKIHPHQGEGFNAYYLRLDHSVNFFDGRDDVIGQTFHGSESLDVVSHEVGHAILDGMKPGLVGWFGSPEAGAFHESFGDVAAILTTLQDERVIERLVEQTGGNLHQENLVANMAEELSRGINDTFLNGSMPTGWTIRNANNALVYQDPDTLPKKPGSPDGLAREPHSFSRIFTGACWDLLDGLVQENMGQGMAPRQAIIAARDTFAPLYAHMVELGPNRMKRFQQMADAMMVADTRYFGGRHLDLIEKTFDQRKIRASAINGSGNDLTPHVALPQGFADAHDADALLTASRDRLGIPAQAALKAEAVWQNRLGETFVRFGAIEEMELDAHTTTDLQATLTLGFDESGSLFHRLWEPVDAEQEALALQSIARLRDDRSIAAHAPTGDRALIGPDGKPVGAYLEQNGGKRKLVKVPVAA